MFERGLEKTTQHLYVQVKHVIVRKEINLGLSPSCGQGLKHEMNFGSVVWDFMIPQHIVKRTQRILNLVFQSNYIPLYYTVIF